MALFPNVAYCTWDIEYQGIDRYVCCCCCCCSRYQDMHDQIHVDEKWFFLMREKERYLLHQDKKNPKHCVTHKSHITKVMFLCAVVRPHFNTCFNSWWEGKLGIWPIGDWEPAKRKSKNRPKGVLVWKNKIVTKEVYHDLLITKLILSILEKLTEKLSKSKGWTLQSSLLTLWMMKTRINNQTKIADNENLLKTL